MAFHVPHEFRVLKGPMGSDNTYGNNGKFIIPGKRWRFQIIASDGLGWEHVSVTLISNSGKGLNRNPNWNEMCAVKDIFWDPVDTVMQLHPPESMYVNDHPHCLHLWRPADGQIPMPPPITVGIPKLKQRHRRFNP